MNLQKLFITTIIATTIGIVSLIALTLVITLLLPVFLNLVNPPPPDLPPCPYLPKGETFSEPCDDTPSMWPESTFHNIFEFIISFVLLYFLSSGIAGFISGFFLNNKKLYPQTYYWQSLISGLIIGAIGPVAFITLMVNKSYNIMDVIMAGLIFGLPAALVALGGYYIAGRRNKVHFTTKEGLNFN